MQEAEAKNKPSFTELVKYVVSLAESVQDLGINLNQPISQEQRQTVLDLIDKSDARLKKELISIIGLGMLDNVRNSIQSNYGNEKIGASSLTLLNIYSSNTYK